MKSITEIISPITLLDGSHGDTGSTGQGCFMNVVAYLNGEAQITDKSPCVCDIIRPIAIWFNDFLENYERQELVPFISRAMGSKNFDQDVINQRLELVVEFAKAVANIADEALGDVSINASVNAAINASVSAAVNAKASATFHHAAYPVHAAQSVISCASHAAIAAFSAGRINVDVPVYREKIKAVTFKFLNSALPNVDHLDEEVFKRAITLVHMAKELA
jgi:hypothetical protein